MVSDCEVMLPFYSWFISSLCSDDWHPISCDFSIGCLLNGTFISVTCRSLQAPPVFSLLTLLHSLCHKTLTRAGGGMKDKGVICTFHTHLFLIPKLITLDSTDTAKWGRTAHIEPLKYVREDIKPPSFFLCDTSSFHAVFVEAVSYLMRDVLKWCSKFCPVVLLKIAK